MSATETAGETNTDRQTGIGELATEEAVTSTDRQAVIGETATGEVIEVSEARQVPEIESGAGGEQPTEVMQATTESEPEAEGLYEDRRKNRKVAGEESDKEEVNPRTGIITDEGDTNDELQRAEGCVTPMETEGEHGLQEESNAPTPRDMVYGCEGNPDKRFLDIVLWPHRGN